MRTLNLFTCGLMLAIFLGFLAVATTYPVSASLMPYVVGIPGALLCLLQVWIELRSGRQVQVRHSQVETLQEAEAAVSHQLGHKVEFEIAHEAPTVPEPAELSPEELRRREIIVWSYFLGLVGGVLLFGFWVAVPVFMVAFLRFRAERRWITALCAGLGASLVFYYIFEKVLLISVFRGFVTLYLRHHL